MTDITKFFEALSWRAYKENDLSDVTFAMCEANTVFKQFFLDFFFKDQELKAGECTIEREVSYAGFSSRPDIVIRDRKKGVYFVEVKIWDGKHHFAQYAEVLVSIGENDVENRFGYITAYQLCKEALPQQDVEWFGKLNESSRVKTWKDFCDNLAAYNSHNDESIKAYLKYCRNLCDVDELYPSLLQSYSEESIQNILALLGKVAESDRKILSAINVNSICEYNQAKYFNPTRWMGHHFSFSSKGDNDNHDVWAWIGVWLGKWGVACCRPCIVLRDCKGWGKIVCDKLRKESKSFEEEDGKMFLPLTLDAWEKPEETLKTFIGWVRGEAAASLKDIILDVNKPNSNETVDSAKMFYLIPMFIRNELTGEFNVGGKYEVSHFYGNDAQQPKSWCGEYLSVKKVDEKNEVSEKMPASGKTCYIGFYFGDTISDKESGLYFEVDGKSEKIGVRNLEDLKGVFGHCLDWAWSDKAKKLEEYIKIEQRGAV